MRRHPHCGSPATPERRKSKRRGHRYVWLADSRYAHVRLHQPQPCLQRNLRHNHKTQTRRGMPTAYAAGIPPTRIPKSKAKPSASARRPLRSQGRSVEFQNQSYLQNNDRPTPCSPDDLAHGSARSEQISYNQKSKPADSLSVITADETADVSPRQPASHQRWHRSRRQSTARPIANLESRTSGIGGPTPNQRRGLVRRPVYFLGEEDQDQESEGDGGRGTGEGGNPVAIWDARN